MNLESAWTIRKKIFFRFSFLFLGISTIIGWHLVLYLIWRIFNKEAPLDLIGVYTFLAKPLHWFDKHFFHIGYDPNRHPAFPSDNHYGVVFFLTLFVLTIIATAVWSILARNRSNYNRLSYWFNVYLRYVLALVLAGYGIDKLIPTQMSRPDVVELITPLGEQNGFSVLWDFMGYSPGYEMMTGAFELAGSILLFSRRTMLAGYLLLLAVMTNVVALNWFYNIPVKLFSFLLLLYLLYLVAPYLKSVVKFLFYRQLVIIEDHHYRFQTNWKQYTLFGILLIVPLVVMTLGVIGNVRYYNRKMAAEKKERNYEVVSFFAKDTLPPLLTDTLRWRRLLIEDARYAVVCNMKDERISFLYKDDTIKKIFSLSDESDSSTKYIFEYSYPQKNQFALAGKWKGNDVKIVMESKPVDSMALRKEKIVVMQD
ncbi:MAG: hypothetical protein JST75_20035 [Bacteroidetes bacterium]|nr:hypothetical protein [Bacteroidota bacterium]